MGTTGAMLGLILAMDPSVDLTRTWVYAGNERLAMGGAGLGFASGAAGLALSPAAVARRRAEQRTPLGLSGTLRAGGVGGLTGGDRGNLGDSAWRSSLLGLDGPAMVQGFGAGAAGIGLVDRRVGGAVLGEAMALRDLESPGSIDTADLRGALGMAVGDHAAVGLGARVCATRISTGAAESRGLGVGAEAGVLLQVPDTGINLGLTARSPVVDGNPTGALGVEKLVASAGGLVGVSWASNAMPTPPSRRPLRAALDLDIEGPVAQAVSAESLAHGAPVARGARWTVSPHLGAEVEVWPDHLRVLGGSYLEPARVAGAQARLHGTAGLQVGTKPVTLIGLKLPLALRCAFDLAPRVAALHWIGLSMW